MTQPAILKEISQPVAGHLERFDTVFRESIRSRVGLVDLVVRYILRQKGKRIRPLLVLLSADLCGGVSEATYRGAALVEILHTATLVHDDVIDEAETRRGLASINAVWKNKIAVLMGDYLLSKGLLVSLDNGDVAFLKITSTAVRRMSEGELHQLQKMRQLNTDEETYYRIIGDKTASLLSSCCEIGAVSATADAERHRLLREYGEAVGMAFQIRDDLLDYVGKRSLTGKPTGLDVSERKLTLPMIHALSVAPKKESRKVLGRIKEGGKRGGVRDLVAFVETYGGIEYATRRAREFSARAQSCLEAFPESPARDSLQTFARFVVDRET